MFYRQLASITDYLMIAQNKPFIERYNKQEDGRWVLAVKNNLKQLIALLDSVWVMPGLKSLLWGLTAKPFGSIRFDSCEKRVSRLDIGETSVGAISHGESGEEPRGVGPRTPQEGLQSRHPQHEAHNFSGSAI